MIKIFQVYYADGQSLDPQMIPVNGIGVNHGDLYENHYIRKLPEMVQDLEDIPKYVGLTSWRCKEKTSLSMAEIERKIRINDGADYDAFAYYPNYNQVANIGGSQVHINVKKALLRLSKLGLFDYGCLLRWKPVMSNYWLVKTELLQDYVTFLNAAINHFDTDEELSALCQNTVRHRDQDMSIKPFILEYLFGIWVVQTKIKLCKL